MSDARLKHYGWGREGEGMSADERKFGLRQVIVLDRPPDLAVVAITALGAEALRVRVIGLVATVAVLGNFVLVHAGAMAAKAVDLGVPAEQRKTSLLLMIELRRLPLSGGVALATIGTALTAVRIVRQMAADTALGPALVAAAQVTTPAAHALVRSGQRK